MRDTYCEHKAELEKLSLDMPDRTPEVGDRVIVAAGVVGHGHYWVRWEAVVLECADTSYHIQYTEHTHYDNTNIIEWVQQALITDVLGP